LLCKYLQSQQNSSVQTTATTKTHHPLPLFQLTVAEVTTADPRCSESCRSVDCCAGTCSRRNHQQSVQTNKHNRHRRLRSNSQFLKRRQLTHGARNRAAQWIVVQVPAKSTKSPAMGSDKHNRYRRPPLQLTVAEATTTGPRCSESRRSVDCWTRTCKVDENTATRSDHTIAHRRSNSQARKRRQLAHGARNRARQLTVVQVPAKPTKSTAISLVRHRKAYYPRFCADSQELKRRKLAHGARNRAGQSIVMHVPASKSPAIGSDQHKHSRPSSHSC
jgi:hypothetical protein